MTKFICFFSVLMGFCASGICQVPTGTVQRNTNDTLIKKNIPRADKYNSRSTKWPKRDSLKIIPKKRDTSAGRLNKNKKINSKQKN